MRVPQPIGVRGSLKWIQRAVAARWPSLEGGILERIGGARAIEWLSPLRSDDYAEYRDGAFLGLLGLEHLEAELRDFWPSRGPQWDALGRTDAGHVLLVEAKAHVGEFCSPPSQASGASLEKIRRALACAAQAMGVRAEAVAGWHRHFYQYTNRLAHLWWLRSRAVDAKLVFVNFIHDDDMPGETTQAAWEAARRVADHVLGIGRRHVLSPHVIHVFPDVAADAALGVAPRDSTSL